jgi:uncharacterized protein (DUF1810 family)
MDDPHDLRRFVAAQAPVMGDVLAELRAGAKRTHWMWFVFPQLAGLGHSPTARHFAIASLAQARAYLHHPVLGARLVDCARLVNGHPGLSASRIFGTPDDLKFRSSMTLFSCAAPDEPAFAAALDQFFAGRPDPLTLDLLG